MDSKEIKEQVVSEIIQSLAVPILSGFAFLVWIYNLIKSSQPGILIFPLSAIILTVLFLFSGLLYGSILLGLATLIGMMCVVLTHTSYYPLIYFLEVVWLWGVFFAIKNYQQEYVDKQNNMREQEEVLETKLSYFVSEMSDIKNKRIGLSKQISDYKSLGQMVQIFCTTLQEEKILPLLTESAARFIGRGSWKIRRNMQGDLFAKYIKRQKLPLMISDLSKDTRFSIEKPKFQSMIAIPLEIENDMWGMLEGTSPQPEIFSEADLRLLSILGGIASLALNNVFLYKRTQELAITDGLTGLYVQRYFKERLDEEIQRSNRHQLQLSVALIDIDHFKDINDTYGHMAGDAVLRQLSDLLRHRFRETDFLCRYGGEEFAVMMMQTDIREAFKVCESIRKAVETEKFFLPVESFKPVQARITVSVGVAKLAEKIEGNKELLSLSDEALYRAKSDGRNKVVISA